MIHLEDFGNPLATKVPSLQKQQVVIGDLADADSEHLTESRLMANLPEANEEEGSLESEKARWEEVIATLNAQISTIASDILSSSASLKYGFDQSDSQVMGGGWVYHVNQANLKYKFELSLAKILIQLGNQDVNSPPAFTMFISTRDNLMEYSSNICSRAAFHRPEMNRSNEASSKSTGNILGDNKVINTLDILKKEDAEVKAKVEETELVMKEVDEATSEYLPLAQASSSVLFIIEQLHVLNHFHQFSLRFFLDVLKFVVLHNPNLLQVENPKKRLEVLLNNLYIITFKQTSRTLLHCDHLTLDMLSALTKLEIGE
ncbi:hypothetical protein BY996DRAFT_8401161 [Phakopsora pachyrhizi]|nr:hypothetical protein BY996DRAFT_8401161 [Phakopsora pachyrhizi]